MNYSQSWRLRNEEEAKELSQPTSIGETATRRDDGIQFNSKNFICPQRGESVCSHQYYCINDKS